MNLRLAVISCSAVLLIQGVGFASAVDSVPSPTDRSGEWGDLSAPIQLSGSDSIAGHTQVTLSTDGARQLVAWTEIVDAQAMSVNVAGTSDGGATWTRPVQIDPRTQVGFNLASSRDGLHNVVATYDFPKQAGDGISIFVSREGGEEWRQTATLAAEGTVATIFGVRLAASSSGGDQVLGWTQSPCCAGREVVHLASSSDFGATWTTVSNVDIGDSNLLGDVAVSASGSMRTAILTVASDRVIGQRVYASTSRDGGRSWSQPLPLSAPGTWSQESHVLMSTDGARQVATWTQATSQGFSSIALMASVSTDGGRSWSNPIPMTPNSSDAFGLIDASDDAMNVTAVTSEGRVVRSDDGGMTWGDATSPFDRSTRPQSLSLSADGTVQAISAVRRDGFDGYKPELAISSDAGLTWQTLAPGGTSTAAVTPDGASVGVTWLRQAGEYQPVYYSRANFVPPQTPSPPTGVSAYLSRAGVRVTWSSPGQDGGSPVTSYIATASPGGKICTTAGNPTCTISGLTPGTQYTFTVKAGNKVGFSIDSSASHPITWLVRPGRVRELNVTPAGPGSARITWKPPPNLGGALSVMYRLRVGRGPWKVIKSPECLIKGLPPRSTVIVTVIATNGAGEGPRSEASGKSG